MKFSDIKLEKGEGLVLRTANADGTSYGGFKWPKSGPVECKDWDKKPECGHGPHGLLDGDGDYSVLSMDAEALWQILKVKRKDCIEIDHKVKFPRCEVLLTTDMPGAMAVLIDYWMMRMPKKSNAKAGKLATSGHSSQLAASGHSSQLVASGKKSIAVAVGPRSTANAAEDGCIALSWWDEKAERYRLTVGYVGENGIKANTIYHLSASGEFEEAK